MEKFPSNSTNSREPRSSEPEGSEEKVVRQVTTGKVIVRKKTLTSRARELFIGDDVGHVIEDVVREALVPAAKDMIIETFMQALQQTFFGRSRIGITYRPAARTPYNNAQAQTPYNRMSTSTNVVRDDPRGREKSLSRSSHVLQDIIVETRQEADAILFELQKHLAKYDNVSVGDLFDMLGRVPQSTDEKWGWRDLRGSGARLTRGGYLLILPATEPID